MGIWSIEVTSSDFRSSCACRQLLRLVIDDASSEQPLGMDRLAARAFVPSHSARDVAGAAIASNLIERD